MQQTKQNPLVFYLRMLLYMFIALFLRLAALSPLVCLFAFPDGSALKWLWLACPVLIVFFILPLRFSFAQAVVQPARKRYFSFDSALGLDHYGEKLSESLLHVLHVVKWGLPLFGMLGVAAYWYSNVDALTVLKTITSIGEGATAAWYGVVNFFRGLFGAQALTVPQNNIMVGVFVLGGVLLIGVLVWLYGAVRNSATRYLWAVCTLDNKDLYTERRRRLRGRRWRQLGVALLNLVLWVPFLGVTGMTLADVLSDVSNQLMMAVVQSKMPVLDLAGAVMPLVLAFLLLYMPLLPVRRYLTAAFAVREVRHTAPRQQEAAAQQ